MNFPTNRPGRSMAWRMRTPAVLALALLTSIALAQEAEQVQAPAARFSAGTINSVEAADKALIAAAAERARIAAQFANDERACYSTFFATSCLDNAKKRRHGALLRVRPVEVEANTFKRRQRVVERDRQLDERRANDRSAVLLPANVPPQAGQSSDLATENSPQPVAGVRGGKVRNEDISVRRAPRAVQPKGKKTEQASDAQKRADNVAAYKRKVAESEARQRAIALKKAEKEKRSADNEKAVPKP